MNIPLIKLIESTCPGIQEPEEISRRAYLAVKKQGAQLHPDRKGRFDIPLTIQ